jgi:non-heme chloroperoxidase
MDPCRPSQPPPSCLPTTPNGPLRSSLSLVAAGLLTAQVLAAAQASQSASPWRDPSPHQVRWITVDSSVRLEVLDWGGSGLPLVLLGCYLTAHVYDEFAPTLTNQFHVYGITRRGIGASDKPAIGYAVQRSADDLLEVLDSLKAQKSLLVGNSCAGQVLTMFASQHSDRLSELVYLDGASDPTTPPYDPPLPDPTTVPRPLTPTPEPDRSSFKAFTKRPGLKVTFPEAEWHQQFVENPDGSVGESLMNLAIRQAITVDAKVKPNYAGIRVPVLAMYQAQRPFEEVAAEYDIRNEQERAALRQQYTAIRAMYTRWQQDLLAAIPTARIVELPGANLYMFLSNEADVLREIRAFADTLTRR